MSFDIPADMYFTMSALMIHDIAGVSVSGSQSEGTSAAVGHSWSRAQGRSQRVHLQLWDTAGQER